ncbi:MAG: MASE1 domain-containing protein [Hyphomicrobiales bacterium]
MGSLQMPRPLLLVLFTAGYLLGAGFGQWVSVPSTGITLWPPAGIFLATLLLAPRRTWPYWVGAAFIAEALGNLLWFHNPAPVMVLLNAGNVAASVAGAMLIERLCSRPRQLTSLNDVVVFAAVGAALVPAISATTGSLTLAAFGIEQVSSAWPMWWIGDATGVLIFAPLTLVAGQSPSPGDIVRDTSWQRLSEAILLAMTFIAVAIVSLSNYLPFAFVMLPPLLWAAVRFEVRGVALALTLLAVMMALFSAGGLNHATSEGRQEQQVLLQLLLAVCAFSGLVVAALSHQHRAALAAITRVNSDLERRVSMRTAELNQSELRLRLAQEAAGLGAWEFDLATGAPVWSDQTRKLLGVPADALPSLDLLLSRLHPEDRPFLQAEGDRLRTLPVGESFRNEFRVVDPDGSVRWLEDQGRVTRVDRYAKRAVGVIRDITDRKRLEEESRLLMREVNHRSKNLLSLVQAIARQTATTGAGSDFVEKFQQRLAGLAANHDLLVNSEWNGVEVGALVRSQLAPFRDLFGERIMIDGPSATLNQAAAQSIGLALNELSTNAAKYGALSNAAGCIEIVWRLSLDEAGVRRFSIAWTERNGPPVVAPARKGFGTTVIREMSRLALDADVAFEFPPDGVRWCLACEASRALQDATGLRVVAQNEPPPKAAANARRVLVVEDEALLAFDIAMDLRQAGYTVVGPAATNAQAMQLIEGEGCDAAVLDIRLGRELSEPVARKLKEMKLPFVCISSYARRDHPPIYADVPFLAKPLARSALVDHLDEALDADARPDLRLVKS